MFDPLIILFGSLVLLLVKFLLPFLTTISWHLRFTSHTTIPAVQMLWQRGNQHLLTHHSLTHLPWHSLTDSFPFTHQYQHCLTHSIPLIFSATYCTVTLPASLSYAHIHTLSSCTVNDTHPYTHFFFYSYALILCSSALLFPFKGVKRRCLWLNV